MARNSIQRQIIKDALAELSIHATAEQVYDFVHARHPLISKGTVYRNLADLAQNGEILNVGPLSGSTHYDHNLHAHSHAICTVCGKVFDIEYQLKDLEAIKKQNEGKIDISEHTLFFKGVCRMCVNSR